MKLLFGVILIALVITLGCTSQQDQCPQATSCDGVKLDLVKLQQNDRQSHNEPYIFSGAVKNTDTCTIKDAVVGINFYDEKGNLLDNIETDIKCINPGESKDFNLRYSGSKLESIRDYKWYILTSRES
jgi:hypothetical protein